MSIGFREMDPKTPAGDALAALGESGPEADERLVFPENDDTYVVHTSDLRKMQAMGLGDLPIECIAVQETSPILHLRSLELRHTLDIANKLTQYFPGHMVAALYELQSLVRKGGFNAYVIGGNVRDILLYKERLFEIEDVDITIEGDAIASSLFITANSKNFTMLESFPEFGTVKISYKDSIEFDIASTRKEIYHHCGALPEVVKRGVPLAEDIIRRDFSVNALAMSIHDLGKILDHANGIEDVDYRFIRVLHPLSFFEDPSRILRAFKFLARLDFTLTPGTERLLVEFLKYGDRVYHGGGDRIKYELCKFLSTQETAAKHRWLDFFLRTGSVRLINMALPLPPARDRLRQQFDYVHEQYPAIREHLEEATRSEDFLWELYLCILLGEIEDEILLAETENRLGLNRHEREVVEKFLRLRNSDVLDNIHDFSPAAVIYEAFRDRPLNAVVAAALEKYRESGKGTENGRESTDSSRLKIILQALKVYKDKFEHVRPELNGNDLIELGVPESAAIGTLLKELLHAKLAGRLQDRIAEVRFIQQKLESAHKKEGEEDRHGHHPAH